MTFMSRNKNSIIQKTLTVTILLHLKIHENSYNEAKYTKLYVQ